MAEDVKHTGEEVDSGGVQRRGSWGVGKGRG